MADSSSLSCHYWPPLLRSPCSEESSWRWGEEEAGGRRTRTCAGGGRRGEAEAGLCWGPSIWGEVRQGAAFWGAGWLGFCVAAEGEEEDLYGNLEWSLDGAGTLQAPGEEGRKAAALWVDLESKKRRRNCTFYFSFVNFCFPACLLDLMFCLHVKLFSVRCCWSDCLKGDLY